MSWSTSYLSMLALANEQGTQLSLDGVVQMLARWWRQKKTLSTSGVVYFISSVLYWTWSGSHQWKLETRRLKHFNPTKPPHWLSCVSASVKHRLLRWRHLLAALSSVIDFHHCTGCWVECFLLSPEPCGLSVKGGVRGIHRVTSGLCVSSTRRAECLSALTEPKVSCRIHTFSFNTFSLGVSEH